VLGYDINKIFVTCLHEGVIIDEEETFGITQKKDTIYQV
jgi:hypothetical protein